MVVKEVLLREVAGLYREAQLTMMACCDIASQTQCKVIMELGRQPGITAAALGQLVGMEKSWLSRVIKQLVAEGYVYKRVNTEDGRSALLYLSPAGEAHSEQLNDNLNLQAEAVFERIPVAERLAVEAALGLLRDALKAHALDESMGDCEVLRGREGSVC